MEKALTRTVQTCLLIAGLALMCLALGSCWLSEDMGIHGSSYAASINTDGSNFRSFDARIYGNCYSYPYYQRYGYPYYYSDDEVFYIGDRVFRKGLETTACLLTPDTLLCSDKRWLALAPGTRKLYFAADGDLYECGFSGEGIRNLTPANTGTLLRPTLSADGRYLTAIRKLGYYAGSIGPIVRLDLQTLEMNEVSVTPMADVAWYNSLQDKYYYHYRGTIYLVSPDSPTPQLLMQASDPECVFAASHDRRFFALLAKRKLQVYDSDSGQQTDMENCDAFAFLPQEKGVIVSTTNYGVKDLRLYDPETWDYSLIFDGIISTNFYLSYIRHIEPRWDGDAMFFDGNITERGYPGKRLADPCSLSKPEPQQQPDFPLL